MPGSARIAPGNVIFHVLNRANARARIFAKDLDFQAFEQIIGETANRIPVRVLAYCVMPNHWHMVLWPRRDGDLGHFVQRLTTTHVRRWHLHRGSVGSGHLYQGTYKSFPIQDDKHFLTVSLCGAKSPAGWLGAKSRGLALVEPAQQHHGICDAKRGGVIQLACFKTGKLGVFRQSVPDSQGTGGTAVISTEGSSFWERKLENRCGRASWFRIDAAPTWTATQGEIEYWTYPLFSFGLEEKLNVPFSRPIPR